MFGSFSESITSLIYDLSLEKITNKLLDSLDQRQLSDKLNEQIKRYEKDILINLDEDVSFDFVRVNQYIKEHLFDKVSVCFNLPEAYQRKQARRNLLEAVYSEAGADTVAKKRIVYHYIQMFLQITEVFYLEKIDDKALFLAGKTVDDVTALTQKYLNNIENRIVDAIQYRGSFAEYIDGIIPSPDNTNVFHYRNEMLRFRGREPEMQVLSEFIKADKALLWMAVTGAGGTGKSKLLYHFAKSIEIDPKWKSVWIHSGSCDPIFEFNEWRYTCNLFIVIDYAGTLAAEMGKWMERLERSCYRPDKIRFVFIEREGRRKNNSGPLWYQNLQGSGEQTRCVERLAYKEYNGTPFLKLSALEKNQLERIIKDYAKIYSKVLSDNQIRWILEKAEEIDGKQENARVLIVIFTADAVVQGREYKNWDIQYLISEIIKKYAKHWEKVICQNSKSIFNALTEMLVFSTVVGEWKPGNKVPEIFENSSSYLCSMNSYDLEQLICEVNEEKQFEGKLKPLEPDLIGEYYVLDYWTKKKYDRNYLKKLFCGLWEYPVYFAQFIDRCIQNYIKQDVFQYLFQNGMERLMPPENNELGMLFFSMLLVNLIGKQAEHEAIESVRRLEVLSGKNEGNEEIALMYAQGLFNLSCDQEEAGAQESINRLKVLSGENEGNEEIALMYAQGLFNLSNKQKKEGAKESVKRLEILSGKYDRNKEIAIMYAKGLVDLLNRQEEAEAKESISRLKLLSRKNEGNEEIAIMYARGLFNLSCDQEEAGAQESISCLEELSKKNEGNEEIAVMYAQGLFNLSNKQEEAGAQESVNRLELLSEKNKGNKEIAIMYAQGLFNLSNKQEEAEAQESINRLEVLNGKNEGNKK